MRRLVAIVVLAACGSPAGDATGGKEVFQSTCAACHGPKGQPDATLVARLGVKDLTATELRVRITPELVEKQVRNGSKNKMMPSFEGALTDAQIRSVAVWVASSQFLIEGFPGPDSGSGSGSGTGSGSGS